MSPVYHVEPTTWQEHTDGGEEFDVVDDEGNRVGLPDEERANYIVDMLDAGEIDHDWFVFVAGVYKEASEVISNLS